jgi:hypothetical protein
MSNHVKALYVIAAVQLIFSLALFAISLKIMQVYQYEAAKSIGAELIKMCEGRYMLK